MTIERTKSYPNHRDPYGYVADPVGQDALTQFAISGSGISSIDKAFEFQDPFMRFNRFHRRQKPNFNDPIVLFHLLDALYNSQRGAYLRPYYLVPYLNRAAPLYNWTTDLVGRMLAGLYEASWETYFDEVDEQGMHYIPTHHGDGTEISEKYRKRDLPFAMGRDARSKYYVIDPANGYEGRLWLLKFRMQVGKLCYEIMREEQDGNLGAKMGKFNTPGEFYSSICPDPIMSAQAFRRRDPQAIPTGINVKDMEDLTHWEPEYVGEE